MIMKNLHSSILTVNDFNDICRVCLKRKQDMIDIYATGIYHRIMEVTNVEIISSDKLANKMCQDCSLQLENFHKFQCQVKDSDNYLRTLMLAEENFNKESVELNFKTFKKGNLQNGKEPKIGAMKNRNIKVLKKNPGSDKMYLIVVTGPSNNSESKNEICIKDLDQEDENVELTDFCRAVVEGKSSGHFYNGKCPQLSPIECKDMNEDKEKELGHNLNFIKAIMDFIKSKSKLNVYKVSLNIYHCNQCNESFDSVDNLTNHLVMLHKISSSSVSFLDLKYFCTVCSICESDKNIFLKHLIGHKKQGFSFIKVNAIGDYVPLTELEKEVFEVPTQIDTSRIKCKIFKISVNCYKCFFCKKLIESDKLVMHHFKLCHQNFKKDFFSSHVRYTCPACLDSWIDDEENFYRHLHSHKKDHVFFIKVDSLGREIDLSPSDSVFTPFVRALEMLKFDSENGEESGKSVKTTKVVKMQDIQRCDVCNHEPETGFHSLSLHYSQIHNEVVTVENVCCPVCSEVFRPSEIYEDVKFYKHLMKHKDGGISFLKIKRDGSVVDEISESSELFSSVNDFFAGKVDCPELEFIADFFAPEILIKKILDLKNKYFCDMCHKGFSKKKGVFSHLKSHMKDASKAQKEYVCEKCGRQIFGIGNYKRHFLTHRIKCDTSSGAQKRPVCSICSKTFSNRAALNEHKRHHLNEGVKHGDSESDSLDKNCEICGRKFASKSSLAKHKKLHSGDKENTFLKCKICERDFRKESILKKHISAHLNPNCFECDVCKLPLLSLASLRHHKLCHQSSSNTFDCKVCEVSFLTEERLIAHQAHTGHHQDRKRFECNVCHEKFFVGRRFMQHIKLHPKYKMGECSVCGKRLATMQSLMLHLSRHFKSNSILCPHCGKHFYEERNYHRHLLTHVGLKPFPCDIKDCTKAFYTFFELNRHKKYHNNTRNFSCSYCPKSFHEANHLKVHIRTHTGERPYICPHCKKGFVTRTRCKQHINLIHQGVGCDLIQSSISKVVEVLEASGS